MIPCALYVEARGPYPKILGAERCWTVDRDARTYAGTDPVVAHPPCSQWGKMAIVNASRWGSSIGEDGGMFAHALATVRRCGGVLEHPAQSFAFARFGLGVPVHGSWHPIGPREWTTQVWQSAYGHVARKSTWLLYVGDVEPPPLLWSRPEGTRTIGGGVRTGFNSKPRATRSEAVLTPDAFAQELVRLARYSRAVTDAELERVADEIMDAAVEIVHDGACSACESIVALERAGTIERGDAVCRRHSGGVARSAYLGGVL